MKMHLTVVNTDSGAIKSIQDPFHVPRKQDAVVVNNAVFTVLDVVWNYQDGAEESVEVFLVSH